MKDKQGYRWNESMLLVTTNDSNPEPVYTELRPMVFLSCLPGFGFSKFRTSGWRDMLVSMPTWLRITQGYAETISDIPLRSMLLNIEESSFNTKEYSRLVDGLKLIINGHSGISIWQYKRIAVTLDMVNLAMQFFFNFATVAAMSICFFSLMSSMYTNVYEQTKEIGILQSLGLTKWKLRKVYIYEAFVLVLSASFGGVLIGTGISWSIVLQQVVLTDVPLPFAFPYTLLLAMFATAMINALIASIIPINQVLKKSTVEIMRFT